MKTKKRITLARQGGAAAIFAALCIVCVLLMAGCQKDVVSKISDEISDEVNQKETEEIQEDWYDLRRNILPPEELPDFFWESPYYSWIMHQEEDSKNPEMKFRYEVYRGLWNDTRVYILNRSWMTAFTFYENGERINKSVYDIVEKGKNWELIFNMIEGIVSPPTTSMTKSNIEEMNFQ